MAIFFTRITLSEIFTKNKRKFWGSFLIDVHERLNVYREFEFRVSNPDLTGNIVIYKNKEVFLQFRGPVTKKNLQKHTLQQRLILGAFVVIFEAYRGKLKAEKFALTSIERDYPLSVNTATPDNLAPHLFRACDI